MRRGSFSGRSAVQAQYPYSEMTMGLSGKAAWMASRFSLRVPTSPPNQDS